MAGDAGRPRTRVLGGQVVQQQQAVAGHQQYSSGGQAAAGSGTHQQQPPSPSYIVKPQPAACRSATPPPAPVPPLMPQPPAPRSWTPTKLSAPSPASRTPRLTPEEALEQEMSELSSCRSQAIGSAVVATTADGWQQSSSIVAGEALSGHAGSPAGVDTQQFAAQHNNLMSGSHGGHEVTGRASPGGLSKLKDMLTHGDSCSTAVEAFSAADMQSPRAAATVQPVVVAHRPGAKPRLLPTGHASTSNRTDKQWLSEVTACINSGDRLQALQLPGPTNSMVHCYIKANTGLLGMSPSYELHLESNDQLLAVARRRKKSASSFYLIGMGADSSAITRSDDQLVGKLKANLVGSEFVLRGKGGDPAVKKGLNAQLLAVSYKPTVNHLEAAPRTMSAIVPVPEAETWTGFGAGGSDYDSLAACMAAARGRSLPPVYERDLILMHTMKPYWDPDKQVHYLDFKGRVTKMSLKNFQLVHWDHNTNQLGNDLIMQFGKRGGHEFAMDFCYPLNLLQAFALALSSIDTKMCFTM